MKPNFKPRLRIYRKETNMLILGKILVCVVSFFLANTIANYLVKGRPKGLNSFLIDVPPYVAGFPAAYFGIGVIWLLVILFWTIAAIKLREFLKWEPTGATWWFYELPAFTISYFLGILFF